MIFLDRSFLPGGVARRFAVFLCAPLFLQQAAIQATTSAYPSRAVVS